MSSPITEYCVEHTPAPVSPQYGAEGGFADYLSCNGDEVDPWGNQPRGGKRAKREERERRKRRKRRETAHFVVEVR
jgi:hypothetical protein